MTKTISLSDDAYELMVAAKGPKESFSELARRFFGKARRPISDLAGAWSAVSDDEVAEMKRRIYQERDNDRPNYWETHDST